MKKGFGTWWNLSEYLGFCKSWGITGPSQGTFQLAGFVNFPTNGTNLNKTKQKCLRFVNESFLIRPGNSTGRI